MLKISIGNANKVYKWSPQARRLLFREQLEETPPIGLRIRSKSKSKSNPTPIPMARNNNEITQIMKMLKKMQARTDESDKRMETMVAALL